MKRIRDEVCGGGGGGGVGGGGVSAGGVGGGGSQFKRPFASSRGESFVQSQVPIGGGGAGGGTVGGIGTSQKLTTNDALTYLKEVKDMFQDQREKYDMFLEVMKDFKAQRTDTAGVIARVKELFKGHNNLIFGFNTFLPKGYEITLDEEEAPPKKTVEFEEAISFVNKIKKRFQSDEHVYKSFLDILNMYRKEHKDINEVYSEVATLFEDHPDLLDEFTRFLPDNSASAVVHNGPYARNSTHRYNERNSAIPLRQQQMDKQRRRDRIIASHSERDSIDQPELEDDKATIKMQKDQRRRAEKEGRDRRNHDQDERELEHDNNRNFSLLRDKKKLPTKVEGFGMNSNVASYDDKGISSQGFIFCEKVKEKLGDSNDYQSFLKCLNLFNNRIIKRNDLQNLVTDLIGKYPDLMEELTDFLDRCEHDDGFLAGFMSKKSLGSGGLVSRSLRMEDKDKEHKHEFDGSREKERYREKYMAKSIQELDLSDCARCTPSYRLLPDDYPIPSASQRSELGAQVLNDHWVSVTSGSEDYSFKHMRRNQYEESLFRCEDDRFELDMLLESVTSTAKRTEELLNSINENKIDIPIHIEEQFTALNLRCIERLYGDHGLDVMDILRKNSTVALPVILTRLKQKQEEWTRCRSDFNKVWAEIYAKNHFKSLDHRSFYFKQQDSKNLSTRALVAEIKELKDKQQEDNVLLAFAAGNRQPLLPHQEYVYCDINIHEDLRKLVEYSCEEVCSTKEQLDKVMRLWTGFVEPVLGVANHPDGTDSSVDEGRTRCPAIKYGKSIIAENGGSPVADPTVLSYKQAKAADNGDESILPEVLNLGKTSLANGDCSIEEFNFPEVDCACKDDQTSNRYVLESEKQGTDTSDRISGYNREIDSAQGIADARTCHMLGAEDGHVGTSTTGMAGPGSISSIPATAVTEDHKLKTGTDTVFPPEVGVAKSVLATNGIPVDSFKASSPFKIEKEEGELSPNGDSEDNFVHGDTSMEAMPKAKHNTEGKQNDTGNGEESHRREARAQHDADADADDEDSENASEAGDDVSGSESAGDECSREDHEDDEDVEHDEVDGKAESEGEAEGAADAHFTGGDVPLSGSFLVTVKPLAKHVPSVLLDEEKKGLQIFYGNDDLYVLFRLHQILYERILSAKINSIGADMKWRTSKESDCPDSYARCLYMLFCILPCYCITHPYDDRCCMLCRFMTVLYNLLDGSVDNAKFEDECRTIIGNQSYVLFTLDKLIYKLVKQLQTVSTDEMDNKLLQLHEYENSRRAGKSIDWIYYDNTRFLLHDENIYRMEFSSAPYRLCIQMMDNVIEKPEVLQVSMDPNFATYLYSDYLSVSPGKKEPHDIILCRNKRKYAGLQESSALSIAVEGVKMFNGLECKIACNSCKISYVLDTEDLFFRPRGKKYKSSQRFHDQEQARVQRFHRFLSAS
ncbi:hypothetical protein K2173_020067 [Erythroxylum novogranatense]|uniref:Histone deacetylase interacting domain-containing protein n=1 Tax=Erythroxylum novogranatense TaxID=1862640 RepID=A0AAV8U723_9ROSI|nr:hypothetical protein K2173_020067 [Erythroxylum novogranatense]